MSNVDDFFLGGGIAPAQFETIGTTIKGQVISSELQQQKDPANGELKFWKDGNPMMQAVITLQTELRDPAKTDDDGKRRLYAKGQMQKVIGEALRKTGSKLEAGGTLVVKYASNGERSNPAFSPPKIYEAAYRPPAVGADDLLGDPSADVHPVAEVQGVAVDDLLG